MEEQDLYLIFAVIILLIGIALALFGRAIWARLLTAIGSMLGWFIGFGIGAYFFGFDNITGILITIILAFVGSIIMGMVFRLLVEAALALLAGLLVGGVLYLLFGNLVVAVIAFTMATILAYVFVEKVVVVVTALIGSLLASAAAYYIFENKLEYTQDQSLNYAVLAFIGLFVLGILIQHFLLGDYDNIRDG